MHAILIADDEQALRKYLKMLFQRRNIPVIEAADGAECVEMYEAHHPAVVLIDVRMPGKSGVEAITEIKAKDCRAKLIAMSGAHLFYPESYLKLAAEYGADAVIPKPIDFDKLVNLVEQFLR